MCEDEGEAQDTVRPCSGRELVAHNSCKFLQSFFQVDRPALPIITTMPKRKAATPPKRVKRKVKTASLPPAVISPPSWEEVELILAVADVDTQHVVDVVGKGEQQHSARPLPPSL